MGHDDLAGLLISLSLGLGLGARHALEPDHLAAIGVLSTETRGARHSALLGAVWGAGHSLALLGVYGALVALSASVPAQASLALELLVSSMLIGLGIRAVLRAARSGAVGLATLHVHGPSRHAHAGPRSHVHAGRFVLATRPLLIGMLHGLAGSGALTTLVMTELPTTSARFAFMILFGTGSVLGMAAASGLAGWPIAYLVRRPQAARWLSVSAGLLCSAVGVAWAFPLLERVLA